MQFCGFWHFIGVTISCPEPPLCCSFVATLHPPPSTTCPCYSLVFRECYVNGILQKATLWNWLLLVSVMPSRVVQDVCVAVVPSSLLSNVPLYGCTAVIGHLLKDIWGVSGLGAVTNRAAVNVCVLIFEWASISIYPGRVHRSGVARSYGTCMFNVINKCLGANVHSSIVIMTPKWK